MKQTILLTFFFLIVLSAGVYGTTPASVSGKPSIYDNWNTAVYENDTVLFMRFDNESSVGENDTDSFFCINNNIDGKRRGRPGSRNESDNSITSGSNCNRNYTYSINTLINTIR